MAYVVWRVFMKKYTKVRLGLRNNIITGQVVTPSEKTNAEKQEEQPAWAEDEDEPAEFSRKGLSKSKRVKSYLQKKCKDVEVRVRSRSKSGSRTAASWYVCTEDSRTEGGTPELLTPVEPGPAFPGVEAPCEVRQEEKVPEKVESLPPQDIVEQITVAANPQVVEEQQRNEDDNNSDTASEGTLLDEAQQDELHPQPQTKVDVAGLVERYFGTVYPAEVRVSLVREARDLLVTSYLGDLAKFEQEFCIPAAIEARRLKEESEKQYCGQYPPGWPLSVHGRLCTHLGGPGPGSLLPGDGFLSLTPQLSLESRGGQLPLPPVLSPQALMAELPAQLKALVVAAERSLARFPLEELAYPCSNCGRSPETCSCHAVERRDSGIQTSPMYEMDSTIPHIDSDDEHSDNSMRNKDLKGFVAAERLADFGEPVINSGIYLPGLHDKDGRALVVVEGDKFRLQPPEAARFLHYLATIPSRCERTRSGLCVLTRLTDCNLDELDSALYLVSQQERVHFSFVIVFSNESERSGKLLRSKIEFVTVPNKERLSEYLSDDQVPSTFGGDAVHDQESWVEFFKAAEALTERCRECGRRLVSAMSSLSGEVTRQQAVQDARSLSRAVTDPALIRLRTQGPKDIEALAQKALRLPASEDVRFVLERVEMLFKEVDSTSIKLEEMVEKRREKLKDIARIRLLEEETEQVLSWLSHKGDDWLRKHKELATTLPAIKQQEQDFEQFYFISMRQLDKGSDLLEEAVQCSSPGSSGLRDLARSLKNHLRGFSDRLEDTRERLEDTSRCFYLLDRAYEWALEAMKHMSPVKTDDSHSSEPNLKQLEQYLMAHPQPPPDHFNEMISLATKLENEKLLNQCRLAQCRCEDTAEQIRSLLGPEPRWPTRRRSAPCHGGELKESLAYSKNLVNEFQSVEEETEWTPGKSWHYASDDEDDKLTSSADNTTEGSESGGPKGCEEVDEADACCGKAISPIPVNSHLHSDLSVEVDGQCGTQTLKTKKTMLLIMKEMIQTERDYVRSLEYVIENYIPELVREDIPQALRGQRNVIFGNIEKIFEFHSQSFLQELEKCEQSPLQVGECFLRHEKKFYLYALYNKNKPKSDALMSEYGTVFFKTKQLQLGDKMDLASYLLKPVQRMGKYALLLQQLMKASRQENQSLKEAENMVRFQLRHGNDLLAMDSLRDCDVNVKEQGRLLRQNEFLVWQGKGSKKYYRHVFLFEELILFSKARRFPDNKNLDLYLYKHSIKTSDIGLTAKVGDSNTKFEIWFRKRKPNDTFTLQAISEEIKHAWTEELSNLLWKQALRNREMRLAEMSSMGIGNKPCLDIRPSINQICDRSISIAQLSKTAPRFRNSIAVSPVEQIRKRPHSIISVTSSSSTSSTSSASSAASSASCERRESSQCSSGESGIVSDWNTSSSVTSDSSSPQHHTQLSVKL